jgi:hypothetical protein
VQPVLPPSGVASWYARVRARDPWRGEFWLDTTPEPPTSAFEDAPPGVVGTDILERLLGPSPPMVCYDMARERVILEGRLVFGEKLVTRGFEGSTG